MSFARAASPAIASCLLALLLGGCATQNSTRTASSMPAAFEHATGTDAVGQPDQQWYQGFGSHELDEFIEQASDGNLDIAAATARVAQADAQARAAGAALLPQLNAGGSAARISGRAGGQSATETDWSLLASASYEADFWGRNRALASAGSALAQASRADWTTVAITVSSSVASTYFQLLSTRERLAIARANLESAREVLQVIEARYAGGAASVVDLATQRATVAGAELIIPDLLQQESALRGTLAVLLGQPPEHFSVTAAELSGLHEPAANVALPSALLTRRPDLIAAEATLQAADADVAAARAALLPTISLTANGGVQNPAVQAAVQTLTGTGAALTLGATVLQTVFDGGRRRAMRATALARQQELVAAYRSSILSALLDVETALSSLQNLDAQQAAQVENLKQSEFAFDGARARYQAGSGDYLRMLETQRLLYAVREQNSLYRLARLQARVGLFRALGGGWQATSK